MEDTIVLKFGGSSIADNEKLEIVTKKIIELYQKNNIIVVVSAQGKTTDKLIEEAQEISNDIQDREMDVLLSCGEQISMAKLSMLLNKKGYPAISLTGWQAGIFTNNTNQNASIESIDNRRIIQELEKKKIVIVAGFQGINEKGDITTLGRGGSDTTAVALAASLNAKECYIFSDVDGIYTADPYRLVNAQKIAGISYKEMFEIANEGAEVLHNRCIKIGEKYNIPLIAKSTFNNNSGTLISNKIEENKIKSIVKKDITKISIIGNGIFRNTNKIIEVLKSLENSNIHEFRITESKITIMFKNLIDDKLLNKIHSIVIAE